MYYSPKENLSPNIQPEGKRRNHTPFRASPSLSRKARNSLLTENLLDNSPISDSTDLEFEEVKKRIEKNQNDEMVWKENIDDILENENELVRSLNFDHEERYSLGEIQRKSEYAQLLQESYQLDEEIDFMNAMFDAMEDNFVEMFSQITFKRLSAEFEEKYHRKPKKINLFELIGTLKLDENPYTEWAPMIEKHIYNNLK
ncbi:hypothetical protein GPJ56_009430 [Histomonas meleagridis]|uniref:uncharacterized protein n=1 Tax=Histomonas meleagridis TaxID=135588 RepID=UPI003559E776|nr:hypothetical protein GPJ56_009430 [Histomonas meleagridis]KAH0797466.1 hypothetical protein GO595_009787 [Histomonas meleagridis]